MNPTAIRAAITAAVGFLVAIGILPQGVEEVIVENAMAVIGGVLMLWSVFAGLRAKAQIEGSEP